MIPQFAPAQHARPVMVLRPPARPAQAPQGPAVAAALASRSSLLPDSSTAMRAHGVLLLTIHSLAKSGIALATMAVRAMSGRYRRGYSVHQHSAVILSLLKYI
jgi:hypothetical protein